MWGFCFGAPLPAGISSVDKSPIREDDHHDATRDDAETHLRRIMSMYASYNEARTHPSLAKDAPISRPIGRFGRIAEPMVGGLHHRYARI